MARMRRDNIIVRFVVFILWMMLLNSKNLYNHLRKRGVLVVVWVLNEDEEF